MKFLYVSIERLSKSLQWSQASIDQLNTLSSKLRIPGDGCKLLADIRCIDVAKSLRQLPAKPAASATQTAMQRETHCICLQTNAISLANKA